MARSALRRWAVAACAAVLLLVVWVPPAAAHTALTGSDPAPGERLAYPPEEILLSFANPVDPATLTVSLRSADGVAVDITSQVDGVETVTAVAYAVPRLDRGVYGLTWQSVGDDGHRARGEVLFGVGVAPAGADLSAVAGDPVQVALDVAAVVARIAWYLALAAAAAIAVLRRPVGSIAATLARARTAHVLAALGAAALLRVAVAAVIVLQAGGGPARALLGRSPLLWAATAAAALLLAVRVHRAGQGDRILSRPAAAWAVLGAAVLAGTLAGHAPTRPDPLLAITFGVGHLGAAAVWVGPLLGVLAATRTPAWRSLEDPDRRDEVRRWLAAVVPAAAWALAVVMVSGGLLALRVWTAAGIPDGAFTWVLVLKAGIIAAVVLPLGWLHHRRAERWTAPPRTVRVEVVGLVAALALGSVLVGTDPGWDSGGGSDQALAALLDGRADDPAACAELDVGRAACYRASLTAVMLAQGPQPAIDALAALSETDDYVAANCHQVAHDLGNDAAERIGDMVDALAVEASICWSGYYHGFVEARLATIEDTDLLADLPSFCDGAADPRYSFTHYNCVHGLGHGLMLRANADLFEALPLCEGLEEHWTIRSCASGAFMENVMAAQHGEDVVGVDDDDLLYPCTAIDGPLVEDCYLMQTSHILWRLDGDLAGAFDWCDTAPEAYRSTCYRSMGRDISGRAALDTAAVVAGCELGDPALRSWCFDGAASNAVYETAATEAADRLCAAVSDTDRVRCTAARDQAAATIAAG